MSLTGERYSGKKPQRGSISGLQTNSIMEIQENKHLDTRTQYFHGGRGERASQRYFDHNVD